MEKVAADLRLKTIFDNCAQQQHRSLLVLFGENARKQVMVIHHLVSKAKKERPSILWCHRRDSDVPKQSRKQAKQLEKKLKSGKCDISEENAFELFLLSTKIKYCSYSDTQQILGTTCGMCVLQDIQGMTPNSLCRVMETVSGGGVILILLSSMSHLKEIYDLPMDAHTRLSTYSHPKVSPLFNERFAISLAWCNTCLVLSESLQVLEQVPSRANSVKPISQSVLDSCAVKSTELEDLKKSLEDAAKPLPQLVSCCRTLDQAKAVLKMLDVLTEQTSNGTVAITAGRGRGKSAALGLAIAAAVHVGLNNIFVTSPSPDNLTTMFEFVFKGFDALGYEENNEYEIFQSSNPDYNQAVVRINVFREHRQVIQYVEPGDAEKVAQAELVVIDEAAAIPLPQVKSFIGQYNVFMASTINGYEGTGRSLSLKLLQNLRQQTRQSGAVADASIKVQTNTLSNRTLNEIHLEESIRYGMNDPVELWLHSLLCLDATSTNPALLSCPPPATCELYYVNKKVLLSGHKESEEFLQQMMSLLVASHYRNSPDDLQVLSDAPAHHLFVLIPPLQQDMASLPHILCVIQVCMEGGILAKVATQCLNRGDRPSGDLVPWTLATQFLDPAFPEYKSARIVRVAAHPDYQSMGYGSRAISLLRDYYARHTQLIDDEQEIEAQPVEENNVDIIVPRKSELPLMSKLSERRPENLSYLSVSYGITSPLYKFWNRNGYIPLYVSQVANKVTGEHTCMMVKPLDFAAVEEKKLPDWLKSFMEDFAHRFFNLLGGPFSHLHPTLAVNVLMTSVKDKNSQEIQWHELKTVVTPHDIQRLEKYCNNLADHHLITDLVPILAKLFFLKRLPSLHLSPVQCALLIAIGGQTQNFESVPSLLDLPIESALGQFNRAMRRFHTTLRGIQEQSFAQQLPRSLSPDHFTPVSISLDKDLEDAAKDYKEKTEKNHAQLLGDISQYAIKVSEKSWEEALKDRKGDLLSIKSDKRPKTLTEEELQKELETPSKKGKRDSSKHSKVKNKVKNKNKGKS
ncbi:RNA cytidine acetyltransferase-like [Oratosquilla oratoria]|uniref:RNA cytidine acetyltransferase-like n=1 Tax=Oratosquilla oratoria TaxID=337810 RepID=UPI003F774839